MPTADSLIAFERRIRDLYLTGELPFLIHLCGGNEAELLEIFRAVRPGDWIFSTHRNHYHYLCAGGSEAHLEALIRAGKSMFVYDAALNFLTSSVLAGTCAIAAGVAWAMQAEGGRRKAVGQHRGPHVWCFLGDGAEEQGHFYEAALFVEAHALPCTFIIEDNGRSVDTPKAERRGRLRESAQTPLDHFTCVERYRYRPTYPHAGDGDPAAYDSEIVHRAQQRDICQSVIVKSVI